MNEYQIILVVAELLTPLVLGVIGYLFRRSITEFERRFSNIERDIESLNQVIIQNVRMEERMKIWDDRQLATGKRLDELSVRVNRYLDERGRT